MQSLIEEQFIKKFVVKDKQERFLNFLNSKNNRSKFTKELYHFADFNPKLFCKIHGNENERDLILSRLKTKPKLKNCWIISANPESDSKQVEISDAIENYVGQEGSILIFGDAEIIYYEGEAPDQRFISV